jgi:Mlc titration factor MtfA (ptsG expression regulator)
MFFNWFKNRRRRKLLAEPFPPAWEQILRDNLLHFRLLDESQQGRLRNFIQILLAEKDWEGCGGLTMTDEIRVVVAGLAGILTLSFDDFAFDIVQSILVYPHEFVAIDRTPVGDGSIALVEESDRLGEAHYRGPVILAWSDVIEHARRPGYGENLVFHEFAHQLDMLNGEADGVPQIDDPTLQRRWEKVMEAEYEKLCDAADRNRKTFLDPYGATDEAEFFAVITEAFFDAPKGLLKRHAELYNVLRDYYRQDPATWDLAEH